jgi:hypothetical protein
MPSVMATLKSDYTFSLIGNQINNLAFSFIAPLGANNHNIF